MIEAQPRSKKGHPPHRTTGVARMSSIQPKSRPGRRCWSGWPGRTSETMTASSGSVSTAPIHRRRVMLINSGLAASAVTVRGSRAMPQMGQAPGRSRTISGCMGQVYSAAPAGVSGAGAIDSKGAGWEPSYLPGLASNFVLQPWAQKYQVRPAWFTDAAAFSGDTFMPHTGSTSATTASATFDTCCSSRNS